MSKRRSNAAPPPASLPVLSAAVVQRFRARPPGFERMYAQLIGRNPRAARWLLDAAESIAPADAADKERYAQLALSLAYMLSEQALINKLHALYGEPFADAPAREIKERDEPRELSQ